MIGLLFLLGILAIMMGIFVALYERCQAQGYSEGYYTYLMNNKQPPPSHRDDITWMGQ